MTFIKNKKKKTNKDKNETWNELRIQNEHKMSDIKIKKVLKKFNCTCKKN